MSSATARRTRYFAQSIALLAAVTAACFFAVLLATRFPVRADVTALREHQLSERTLSTLKSLQGEHEIVIVTNSTIIDPRALERTRDVLACFERADKKISVSLIDVSSAVGQSSLQSILTRLNDRYATSIADATSSISTAADRALQLSKTAETLTGEFLSVADSITQTDPSAATLKKFFADSATVLRVSSQDISQAVSVAAQSLKATIPGTPITPLDQAVLALRNPAAALLDQIEQIADGLRHIAASATPNIPGSIRTASAQQLKPIQTFRDDLARLTLDLEHVPNLPLDDAARVLVARSTALIIGPPPSAPPPSATPPSDKSSADSSERHRLRGITAIDIDSILPPLPPAPLSISNRSDSPGPDLRYRTEELLAGALASLNSRNTPLICLVHGAPTEQRLAPDFPPLAALVQRLHLRGIDIVEWQAGITSDPPALPSSSNRPVVYVVVPTNAQTPDGALRMSKLAAVVADLVQRGKPVLLSVAPSDLPAVGQKDPMIEMLEPLGLKIDSSRPILSRTPTPRNYAVTADLSLTHSETGHPVADAVQSLRTSLTWAVPIIIDTTTQHASGSTITPLLVVPADPNTWAESEWTGFRQVPPDQRHLIANPPAPGDSPRDDADGPWIVSIALEHKAPQTSDQSIQRLLVISSNGWFFDEITQQAQLIDNRPVPLSPGNLELFEAAVYWLAGQENLIARSAQAQSIPLIPGDLAPGTLLTLRWVLIVGLPVGILLLGTFVRLIRG